MEDIVLLMRIQLLFPKEVESQRPVSANLRGKETLSSRNRGGDRLQRDDPSSLKRELRF